MKRVRAIPARRTGLETGSARAKAIARTTLFDDGSRAVAWTDRRQSSRFDSRPPSLSFSVLALVVHVYILPFRAPRQTLVASCSFFQTTMGCFRRGSLTVFDSGSL